MVRWASAAIVLTGVLVSIGAGAELRVPAKAAYEVDVPSPFLMTFCQERLWVYSKERNSFVVLAPADGRKVFEFRPAGAGKIAQVSAVSCYKERLLIAYLKDRKRDEAELGLFEITGKPELKLASRVPSPAKGRVTDLACASTGCFALTAGKLYRSGELGNQVRWKLQAVPSVDGIPHRELDIEKNPFADWQEKLALSPGRYTRLVFVSGQKSPALLDPVRTSVVVPGENGWSRWGQWGVWEGKLLSPKAVAVLPSGHFVVSDPGLRALFLFDASGRYGGMLAEVWHGSQVLASGNRIFAADFLRGKVVAIDLARDWSKAAAGAAEEELGVPAMRVNLFRRPGMPRELGGNRCLICHDGSMRDDSDKYIAALANHPVDRAQKAETVLPLSDDRKMTCASCHDPHHGAGEKAFGKEPPYTRLPADELCISCHREKTDSSRNHRDKKSNRCTECHQPHHGTGKLLKAEFPALCLRCHEKQRFEHRSVAHLLETERASGARFSSDEISCFTCHSTHLVAPSKGLIRPAGEVMPFCASCHGEKTETLFTGFHEKIRNGARK